MPQALNDILAERQRQIEAGHSDHWRGDTWIALILAYLGRASTSSYRNQKEGQDYRESLVKAAALCLAALEAHDNTEAEHGQNASDS